jgi:hypothetical protein
MILEKTAYLCIKEASWKNGFLGADSSGVETDRYEILVRPNKKKGRFRGSKKEDLTQVLYRRNPGLSDHPSGKDNSRAMQRFANTQKPSKEIPKDERIYIQC